jgi:hypothetical protein
LAAPAEMSKNEAARPTLRCLTDDLRVAIPPVEQPLDEIDHPLLAKARDQFADPASPHERIRAIEDEVVFKVKIQRWRGAIWRDRQDVRSGPRIRRRPRAASQRGRIS